MKLSNFLQDLLYKGQVTVANQIIDFDKDDLKSANLILKNYYDEDKLEIPYKAPEYLSSAAIWAAKYLYYAIQLSMLRNLNDQTVKDLLQDFPEALTIESIYSADLCLRYLTQLFDFVKGLSPDDILVKCLEQVATKWYFSSVGIDFEVKNIDLQTILKSSSLTYAYIDRIIKYNDLKRVNNPEVMELIKEVLGNYSDILWSDFSLLAQEKSGIKTNV